MIPCSYYPSDARWLKRVVMLIKYCKVNRAEVIVTMGGVAPEAALYTANFEAMSFFRIAHQSAPANRPVLGTLGKIGCLTFCVHWTRRVKEKERGN
ncbi:hypothetical protein M514_22326 [Trichuris suis]|uniref:Uncharacterized protein n=1 Tax=Trichuris suis TaxID=68888 RepID=A0A085N7R2_9BILA|nr:hypothetical protein M514_22326 [Trichuris suis]